MKVFLSSSVYGNEDRRKLLLETVNDTGFNPIFSDDKSFPIASGIHSHDVCLEAINEADIYVLRIQKRYGQKYLGSKYDRFKNISITHAEFRRAVELHKTIITLCESEIIKQRHLFKSNSSDPSINIKEEVFDFYTEVSERPIDNWIWPFEDSLDCRDKLKYRLIRIHNQNLSKNMLHLRDQIFIMPSQLNPQGTLDVLSYWKIICDTWDSVTKIWETSIYNNSSSVFSVKDKLTLPIFYKDATLISTTSQLVDNNNNISPLNNFSTVIKKLGDPIHGKAMTISLKSPQEIPPKHSLKVIIAFKHSGYFGKVTDNDWINSGVINYLDYPGFNNISIIQRVCKEYFISKELTNDKGELLSINPSPECDWSTEDKDYWVIGYARNFEINERLEIKILLKF